MKTPTCYRCDRPATLAATYRTGDRPAPTVRAHWCADCADTVRAYDRLVVASALPVCECYGGGVINGKCAFCRLPVSD